MVEERLFLRIRECITILVVFFLLSGLINMVVVEIPKYLVKLFFSMRVRILLIPGKTMIYLIIYE